MILTEKASMYQMKTGHFMYETKFEILWWGFIFNEYRRQCRNLLLISSVMFVSELMSMKSMRNSELQ